MTVRRLTPTGWGDPWPMLQDLGTSQPEEAARALYPELLADPRWALVGYDQDARLVG
jgi:hypothetical protein